MFFFTRRNDSITKSKVMYGLFIFRNKDGFLTMGEIKLVNKNATKSEIKVRDFLLLKENQRRSHLQSVSTGDNPGVRL